MEEEKKKSRTQAQRTIKLYCPSLSKLSTIVASDGQRIDIGAISRIFGLDPATVKLNGHFIARGVDLVASSLTWNSIISFFSTRRLPTGTADIHEASSSASPFAALLVDGKLSAKSSQLKRSQDNQPQADSNHHQLDDNSDEFQSKRPNICGTKKQKIVEAQTNKSEFGENNGFLVGCKRKPWIEATSSEGSSTSSISPLKRLRENGTRTFSKVFSWRTNNTSTEDVENNSSTANCITRRGRCTSQSSTGESVKRGREEEQILLASPCKRAR